LAGQQRRGHRLKAPGKCRKQIPPHFAWFAFYHKKCFEWLALAGNQGGTAEKFSSLANISFARAFYWQKGEKHDY